MGDVRNRLESLLKETAGRNGVEIVSMAINPDHVHLFVKASPVDSPHWIVKDFKSYSSRVLRDEFPALKNRLPSLWTRSYYVESVGHISEKTIRKYIEDQKGQ